MRFMLSPLLIEKIVRAALEEDLGPGYRDITSDLTIPSHVTATGVLRAREDGVVAGLVAGLSAFAILDLEFEISVHIQDGDHVAAGQVLAHIEGSARALMGAERVALNIIGHLSGIATETARYVSELAGTATQVCDTRKTLPGLRALQKYAVTQGGGVNHRNGLYDAVMIKDNHIAIAGGIEDALRNAALLSSHTTSVQVEVDTLEQLEQVLAQAGAADIVLLDNMDVDMLAKAVDMVGGRLITEASGGVTLGGVKAIAGTGVDYISVGALTHSVRNFDIGLDIDAA